MPNKPDKALELLCTAFEGHVDTLAADIVDMFTNGAHHDAADMARTFADLVETAAKAWDRTLASRAARGVTPVTRQHAAPPAGMTDLLAHVAASIADVEEPVFHDDGREEEPPDVAPARPPLPLNPMLAQDGLGWIRTGDYEGAARAATPDERPTLTGIVRVPDAEPDELDADDPPDPVTDADQAPAARPSNLRAPAPPRQPRTPNNP